ncbi:MAG TPA: Rne/Rng family ribonuclease [Actinocrinis sp.]|nr:Rne/Rng family ribonuclease [Actinocrinis sp.]
MLENEPTTAPDSTAADTGQPDQAPVKRTRRRAASRPAGTPTADLPASDDGAEASVPDSAPAAEPSAAPAPAEAAAPDPLPMAGGGEAEAPAPARKRAARKTTASSLTAKKATPTANRRRVRAAAPAAEPAAEEPEGFGSVATPVDTGAEDLLATEALAAGEPELDEDDIAGLSVQEMVDEAESLFTRAMTPAEPERQAPAAPALRPGALIFQAPVVQPAPVRRTRSASRPQSAPLFAVPGADQDHDEDQEPDEELAAAEEQAEPVEAAPARAGRAERAGSRRRRSRGGQTAEPAAEPDESAAQDEEEETDAQDEPDGAEGYADGAGDEGTSRRRRRRRRRQTAEEGGLESGERDDPPNTVVKVRESREPRERKGARAESGGYSDDVQGVRGSVRIAAKQQRRRDGRATRSRRAPIITEAEFLARREAVERVMVVRQSANRMQIAVLEDGVLVEHYVNRESSVSYVGNVYLGKVQNVLPSMEAAFVDINKGRNAVLYAGEVNFEAAGLEGHTKRIEMALKSGQPVLVQVTKDPIGHKGARLTSQISLPGRFLVYIPGASMMGISRKLPETERVRLKQILKKVVPEDGGVIVRTAAEGASEEELARDVERLIAQWEEIERKAKTAGAPALLHGEPDLTVRVIRDIFNEDFTKLIVSGDEAYKEIGEYLGSVAPELAGRIEHWTGTGDVFNAHRVDEQLAKGLDRKVWLPSGGSLVIDRTEAMIVIDVNTGKFTGQGSSSLEETVTRNNLEAAEEIVRQLRLRDLGGIIVIDFIDMVLEANRDLVLRRLVECLGRDRTKHQVAEVTSLGLVQMTRKRVGQGLLEAFSETCEHCNGRGVLVHVDPVEPNGHRPAAVSPVPLQEESAPKTGRAARKRQAAVDQVAEQYGRVPVAEPEPEAAEPEAQDEAEPAHESRASRRRRARKGKSDGEGPGELHLESGDGDAAGDYDPAPAEPAAPLNLRAHSEDPDSVAAEAVPAAAAEPVRPRRRRAASRPAGSPGAGSENT